MTPTVRAGRAERYGLKVVTISKGMSPLMLFELVLLFHYVFTAFSFEHRGNSCMVQGYSPAPPAVKLAADVDHKPLQATAVFSLVHLLLTKIHRKPKTVSCHNVSQVVFRKSIRVAPVGPTKMKM